MKYMFVSKFKWVFVNLKETRFTVCVFTKSTSSWEPGQIISVKAVLQRQWEVRSLYKLCSGCFKLCQAPPLCIHVTFLCARGVLCAHLLTHNHAHYVMLLSYVLSCFVCYRNVTVNDKNSAEPEHKEHKTGLSEHKSQFYYGNFKASTEMRALWWMHLLTISHIDFELFLRLAQTLPRKSHHLFPSLFCLYFSVSAAAGCVLAVRGPEALFTLEPQGNSVMCLIVFMECRVNAVSLELVSSFFIDFCLQTSNTILSSDMNVCTVIMVDNYCQS